MDVTYTNVLESTRQYFQGVPTPGGSSQTPGFPPSSYWNFQQKQYRTPEQPSAAVQSHNTPTEQQPTLNNRLPSLASFSSINFRSSSGNMPSASSIKSVQGGYEGQTVPPRYTSPSGYSNYFPQQQQQQVVTKEHHQSHHQQSHQQQNLHHLQQLHQQQQQQQQQQHQQQQHHHQQQLLHQQQHSLQQHHKQQQQQQHQQSITQNHLGQQSVPNHQSHSHSVQIQKPSIQNHVNNLLSRQQNVQNQQHQMLHNHSGIGQQQGQGSSLQQSPYQNHESNHQNQSHGLQSHQQVIQNHHNQNKLLQSQKHQQMFQNHNQGTVFHNLHNSQHQNQSQSHQSSHFQTQQHLQNQHLLSKYQSQNLKSQQQQQMLQNHLQQQSSQQQNLQAHLQNQMPSMARQSPLMSPPQQQSLTRQSPHVPQHQTSLSSSSPRMATHSPQMYSHQQAGLTRHSPLMTTHQALTRQSPHQPNISPHQPALTRQSPLIPTHQPSLPTSSPHVTSHTHLHNQQSSHQISPHQSSHQQVLFSPPPSASAAGVPSTPQPVSGTSIISQVKRESPLDLSVKTIRQSADSTADSSASQENVYYTFHNDYMRSKPSGSGFHQTTVSAPKVEFPSFNSSTLSPDKKRKEAYYPLPSVNCFNKSMDKLYAQQRQQQQQQQQRPGMPTDARYPQNYLKRPMEQEKQPQPQPLPKIPKMELDEWKISMDKMIEKKLAADERHNWQEKMNGELRKNSYPSAPPGMADKRGVLSILRSSLETREARNQQIQMQQKASTPRYIESRLPAGAVVRQNLPSFGALSSSAAAIMPSRLHFPRAVDSIHQTEPQHQTPHQMDIVDITDDDEVATTPQAAPGSHHHGSKADLDGLAAFLASRIRTKAELKQQVTPNSKESPRTSASSSSNHTSPRTTPIFIPSHENTKDLVSRGLTSPEVQQGLVVPKTLPWIQNSYKMLRESASQGSTPRRRCEAVSAPEAAGSGSGAAAPRPSETSVFDFRDSDSEQGDLPLLPIVELRRSRLAPPQQHSSASLIPPPHHHLPNNSTISQTTPAPAPLLPTPVFTPEEDEEYKKWLETCDELVAQLQAGKCYVRKRNRRRAEDMIKREIVDVDEEPRHHQRAQRLENELGPGFIKVKEEPLSEGDEENLANGEEPMKLRMRQGLPQKQKKSKGPRRKKVVGPRQRWLDDSLRLKRASRLGWPKAPTSLPDLHRHAELPVAETIQVAVKKRQPTFKSLGEEKSFLDRLMQRYSDRRKKKKTGQEKEVRSSSSEKAPTPRSAEIQDLKKETVAGFRDDLPAEGDLPPVIQPRGRLELRRPPNRKKVVRGSSAPPPGSTWESIRRMNRRGQAANEKKAPRGGPPNTGNNKTKPFRRKLKGSSGFDYIRKKKKAVPRKEGDPPREKKKKAAPLTEQEIQTEMKSWVLNKGLGETVLHRAARLGNVDVIRYCLEKLHHNAAPRDNAGYTPLHEACARGHYQIASLLVKSGCNVSDSALGGVRPLHEAAENGFTKIIKLLLEHGADPELATYNGTKALSLATDEEARRLMETHVREAALALPLIPPNEEEPAGSSGQKSLDTKLTEPGALCLSEMEGFEVEESDMPLPNLYRLSTESRAESWVLFHELAPLLRVKTREALLKQLGQEARSILRDMKLSDFYAKAHCRAIKGAQNPGPKSAKVTLVKYTDTVKFLLGVEVSLIPR